MLVSEETHFRSGISVAIFRALGMCCQTALQQSPCQYSLSQAGHKIAYFPIPVSKDGPPPGNRTKQCTWDLHGVLIRISLITKDNLVEGARRMWIVCSPVLSSFLVYAFSLIHSHRARGPGPTDVWPWTNHIPLLRLSVSSFVKGAKNSILAPHKIFMKVKTYHGHAIALKYCMLFRW